MFGTAQQRAHGHDVKVTTPTDVVVVPGQRIDFQVSDDLVGPPGNFQELGLGGCYGAVSTDKVQSIVLYYNRTSD